MADQAVRPPRLNRRWMNVVLNMALDGALAALAILIAGWLASPSAPLPNPPALAMAGAVAIWLIGVPFGLSRLHWRFTSMRDLALVGGAGVTAAVLLSLLMIGVGLDLPSPGYPLLLTFSMLVCLTAPRLAYRLLRHPVMPSPRADVSSAILVGTGETTELFLSALARSAEPPYRVTGLVALSARHTGRRVHGLDVLGAAEEAEAVLAKLAGHGGLPDLLIITEPEFSGAALASLLAAADKHGVRVLRAPSLTALSPADQGQIQLQPIAIEDLLNRQQVALDRDGMARLIAGRRVLVTGAGGSIGSELARQVAGFAPASLMLLDNGEFALWQIDLELAEKYPAERRLSVIADVRDAARMQALCDDFKPELVFHAAALKHVPIVEANPLEGLQTNVLGTKAVADAARASGASLMVLISTDKAVNPSSVMGATKRLAEMYCQALDVAARQQGGMGVVTVRFGNVLGSTGSVVPLFRRQLAMGGPLTVTHPDMQRYFMTVREAVGLVLQASVVGAQGGESIKHGGIFVLDMGEPVRIVDLARQMIRLAGLRPETDIGIRFTGLRPGEKLFEELFHGSEQPVPTGYPGLLMASPRVADIALVQEALAEISAQGSNGNAAIALAALARLVPEFVHNADGGNAPLAVCEKAG
ncbi:MAG: nucleotide sugar dehydratase [Acidocella sp. 20-57-95]|nr:MAG: nucleotide sugar dehydratase [Acidocella sp. 20-57-95]OYV62328.1 MAG: nucleotide sugar dehydratase [Acidocella sp. 21-58-7]HQT63224.1 nucleoside-diphosphate sugar epimerase/dehydratase [Acidocella sp.]HQU03789.1 nucleoside-diphosphate sugar epimerase/dehydratase [Acidocella sp.]